MSSGKPSTRRGPVTVTADFTPIDVRRITPRGAAIIAHVVRNIILAPKDDAAATPAPESEAA